MRWAVADAHRGIERAQLVVVNIREDTEKAWPPQEVLLGVRTRSVVQRLLARATRRSEATPPLAEGHLRQILGLRVQVLEPVPALQEPGPCESLGSLGRRTDFLSSLPAGLEAEGEEGPSSDVIGHVAARSEGCTQDVVIGGLGQQFGPLGFAQIGERPAHGDPENTSRHTGT